MVSAKAYAGVCRHSSACVQTRYGWGPRSQSYCVSLHWGHCAASSWAIKLETADSAISSFSKDTLAQYAMWGFVGVKMFGLFILSGGKMWSFVMFHPLAGVKCNKCNA